MNSLATFHHTWQVRLVDTDTSGFAHFSSYVRMMEETEYAFLRSRGLCVILYDQKATLGFPRLSAEINVMEPLRFEQIVQVRLMLTEIDGKQIVYEFAIVDEEGETVVSGKFVAACCRFPDDKPPYAVLIPDHVVSALVGGE